MCTIESAIFLDKKRQRITIRSPDPERDAAEILDTARAVCAAGVGVITKPDELPATVEEETRLLREWNEAENTLYLIATVQNEGTERIIGMGILRGETRVRIRHVVTVALSILPEYQGRGIGRRLMETAVEWAKANPAVHRIQLAVMADNAPAIHIYETMGFSHEGRFVDFVRRDDGSFIDNLQMAMLV